MTGSVKGKRTTKKTTKETTKKAKVFQEGAKTVVKPDADVIATSVPDLRQILKEAVDAGTKELCIDLANAAMIDSLGLGLIIASHNSLSKAGGKLSVINVSRDVKDLFKKMRLDQHFTVIGA